MPELKLCPHCLGANIYVRGHSNCQVTCRACGMEGPEPGGESAAITAWNALPRALTWTTEPPKVAGWYWFSVCKGHTVCIHVGNDGKAKLAKDHFTDAELLGGQWAGPITPPREES